ncbi:MAG: aminopeptidase P family N-terminal domain-containing protein, partial [Duncaniella sp.]|nr:aminopeptidase P family N-terminal domain-containing protein [Duncaniella sp.]
MMNPIDLTRLRLLSHEESQTRLDKIRAMMAADNLRAILISDNANKYYVTGRVFAGYVYIPLEGPVMYFVRRPVELEGDGVVYIRKPEEIAASVGLNVPESIGLELDVTPYSTAMRLKSIFPQSELKNASAVMRRARAVKTSAEIEMIRRSGVKHVHVYGRIPHLY